MKRFIFVLVAIVVSCCTMTSCDKDGDAWKQFEVYVTCEEDGIMTPTRYYNQIPLWTVGYSSNNYCNLIPNDDGTFKFIAAYKLSSDTTRYFYTTFVINSATYELNKKYYVDKLLEGSDMPEAKIKFSWDDYVATSGWIMFSDIRQKSAEGSKYYDLQFECEVKDPETGVVRLSAYGTLDGLQP